ncbi:MAG: hypothetical protein LBV38_04380 [Alistipes sp.]|jgi:hypothetical protein|nr:hypothetical protein [Alistipes sp.]
MESNLKNQDEGALALILAEVKKLTKHFKLDRRSKNDADDAELAESDESERLLRELSEKVGNLADKKEFSVEQVAKFEAMLNAVANAVIKRQVGHDEELKSSLERIEQALDALKAENQDSVIHHEHRHAIDVVSSKNFFVLATLGFVVFVSIVLHIYQFDTIRASRDNDLKYRYVKMHGEATPGDIEALETIFTYDHNPDSIKLIRRQVVQYERLVREQAEKIEQVRLNTSKAERLREEVENVKGGK